MNISFRLESSRSFYPLLTITTFKSSVLTPSAMCGNYCVGRILSLIFVTVLCLSHGELEYEDLIGQDWVTCSAGARHGLWGLSPQMGRL